MGTVGGPAAAGHVTRGAVKKGLILGRLDDGEHGQNNGVQLALNADSGSEGQFGGQRDD